MWHSLRLGAVGLLLVAAASGLGCLLDAPARSPEREADEAAVEGDARGTGVALGALTAGAVLSVDGIYGSCVGPGKTGANWSVSLGGARSFDALAVVKNDAACRLSLTRFHTATAVHTAITPLPLTLTPASTPTLFTSTGAGIFATATVDTLAYAGSSVTVSLFLGETRFGSTSRVSRYTFDAEVLRDAPLSYWRLSEGVSTLASDPLDDTDLVDLKNHGAPGVGWTQHASGSTAGAAAVFDHNYVRSNAADKTAVYSASAAPPASADYDVSASVRVASLLVGTAAGTVDQVGVLGRMATSELTGYFAGLVTTRTCIIGCVTSYEWVLRRYLAGASAEIKTTANLVASRSYALSLRMRGTLLEVLVDGVVVITWIDGAVTAAGRAGLLVGGGNAATTFTTGTLIESFALKTLPYNVAYDSVGMNHGTHSANVESAVAGALAGPVSSGNGALQLGGSNHLSITRDARIGTGDFSIEFWFRYAGNGASTVTNWYEGLGMIDANTSLAAPEGFGVSMRSDGKVMAGAACGAFCTGQVTILSSATYRDDSWHHVVLTRKHTDGVLTLYLDTVPATAVGPVNKSLNAQPVLNVGRLRLQLLNLLWSNSYFTGALDELAIYDKVLSSARVAAHYQARAY